MRHDGAMAYIVPNCLKHLPPDPALFTTNVASVLLLQRKTFLEDELTSNHLCFMGSSRIEEDQLLNMVVAHFLLRKTQVWFLEHLLRRVGAYLFWNCNLIGHVTGHVCPHWVLFSLFLSLYPQFVSCARDGFKALHDLLDGEVDHGLEVTGKLHIIYISIEILFATNCLYILQYFINPKSVLLQTLGSEVDKIA